MTRANLRRRFALEWWCWVGAALLPLIVLDLLFADSQLLGETLEMPLFLVGLVSMFVTLRLFAAYKRALVATEAALDGEREAGAWQELARVRRRGLLGAALPAWVAALAVFSGLNAVALFLLAMSSVVLLCLYRIPRQLG